MASWKEKEVLDEAVLDNILDFILSNSIIDKVVSEKSEDEQFTIYKQLVKVKSPSLSIKLLISKIKDKIQDKLKEETISDKKLLRQVIKLDFVQKIESKCKSGYSSNCWEQVITLKDIIPHKSNEYTKYTKQIKDIFNNLVEVGIYNGGRAGIRELIIK